MALIDDFLNEFGLILKQDGKRAKKNGKTDYSISVKIEPHGIAYNDHAVNNGIGYGIYTGEPATPNPNPKGMQKKNDTPSTTPPRHEYTASIAMKQGTNESHPYLLKKGLKASLFLFNAGHYDGKLYAPLTLYDDDGTLKIVGHEVIFKDGKKGKVAGSKMGFYRIGCYTASTAILAEGIATAWAINKLTGMTAYSIGGVKNAMNITANLFEHNKHKSILTAFDAGLECDTLAFQLQRTHGTKIGIIKHTDKLDNYDWHDAYASDIKQACDELNNLIDDAFKTLKIA
jgi:hypothetical protein